MSNSVLNNLLLTYQTGHIMSPESCAASTKLLVALFSDIVKLISPDIFLEIGARQADFSFNMSSQLPKAKFTCFEANKHSYNVFKKRFDAKKNVDYLNLAVTDYDGSTQIRIPKGANPEVLVKGNASLSSRTNYSEGYVDETVECVMLNSFYAHLDPALQLCAWIDVEGHFRPVYKGGTRIFSRVSALLVEVEDKGFWQDQALASEVFALLHDNGMVAVARDNQSRFFQYNVIFVKQELLDSIKPRLKVFLEKMADL